MDIIGPTTASAIRSLRREYVTSLSAPLDGMWETFADRAAHWEIRHGGDPIGYGCVDDQRRLLQFHVSAAREDLAGPAFADVLEQTEASTALVSTFEPWLAWCLDRHRGVRVHTLLYHYRGANDDVRDRGSGLSVTSVEASDLDTIRSFVRRCLDHDQGEWLPQYLQRLVSRRELFALYDGETLLGTGELRVSDTQPPYADLGVIVSPDHRGQGHAPFILATLRDRCERAGLVPICSTTTENQAARRAIERAGFVERHRLLEVSF